MGGNVLSGDTCITHDGDAGSHFLVDTSTFQAEREGMVGTYLVANFMGYIVDVEIIALWNAICRGSDAAAFAIDRSASVDTNATDTSCIATTATRSKHMTYIVTGFTHIGNQCIFQLHIPVGKRSVGVCTSIVIDDVGGAWNQIEVHGQVFFKDAIATG